MRKTLPQRLLAFVIGAAGLVGSSQAAYTGLVFFGDSLLDTGNVLSLTTAFNPPPFPNYPGAPGRFSNGPVWTESLAAGLGFPTASNPSNRFYAGAPGVISIGPPGGQNYSFGGARTGLGGAAGATTGLFGQLIAWNGSLFGAADPVPIPDRIADPGALYVVVAGANDLRDIRSGTSASTPLEIANNVANAVGLLAQAGARHFLISNLPDLGKTPEAVALGLVPQSTAATLAFNAALDATTGALDAAFLANGIDLDIREMDFYGINEAVYDDAVNNGGAVFGITNVTTPCIAPVAPTAYFFPGSTDINCNVSAFSDPLHPSARAHALIGQLAINAAPEPASLLLVSGALVLAARARRRQPSLA